MLQRGQGDHGLEGRAGRIGRGQGLIEQGLAIIFGQGLVVRPAHAAHKGVGVEAGGGEHAQHIPAAAVHHHRRAAVGPEDLHGPVLNVGIERQLDGRAGRWRKIAAGIVAQNAALDVHLDLARAGLAAQIQVIGFFQPLLADAKAWIEQDGFGIGSVLGDVLGADLGHIAYNMGEGRGEGIDPHLTHIGGDARKLRRAHIDAGKLLPGHVLHQGHGRAAGRGVDLRPQAA